MSNPKFTVIIPTRERFDTLEKSLKTVTNQDYESLEIIVSDNFSGDATEEVVRSESDKRIKYFNTSKRISMSENFEFALSKATGEWVTIIGDDDGLLPNCLEKVNSLIKHTGVEAILSDFCVFKWPSLTGLGYLTIPLRSGYLIRDGDIELSKVMVGFKKYSTLPMLYSGGFVSMSAINRWKAKNGKFYHSCIPDLYSSVVFAKIIEKYVYSYEPFIVAGASQHSIGAAQFRGNTATDSELLPIKIFRQEENIPFHSSLPLCSDGGYPKSSHALLYECYLQASDVDGGFKQMDPEKQLEIILATTGNHGESVFEWGKKFADMHKLNFGQIKATANRKKILLKSIYLIDRVFKNLSKVTLDPSEYPIKDIYQASIAAAAVRAVKLSRTRIVIDKIKKVLRKN